MKQKKKGLDWLAVAVGIVFLSLGIGVFVTNFNFVRSGIKTEGTVIDAVKRDSPRSRRRTTYAPVFTFSTPDGTEYRAQSPHFSGFFPTMGKQMAILYLPNNPVDIIEDHWFYLYGFPGIFVVSGALFISIPAYRSIPKRT